MPFGLQALAELSGMKLGSPCEACWDTWGFHTESSSAEPATSWSALLWPACSGCLAVPWGLGR